MSAMLGRIVALASLRVDVRPAQPWHRSPPAERTAAGRQHTAQMAFPIYGFCHFFSTMSRSRRLYRSEPRLSLVASFRFFLCGTAFVLWPQTTALGVDRPSPSAAVPPPEWMKDGTAGLERALLTKFGQAQGPRIRRGLGQVAQFWHAGDGAQPAFEEFVRTNFAADPATLDTIFNRFEHLLEQLDGHMHEINREFRQQMDLNIGPVLPFDEAFGGYDPSAHVLDDFFQNKLAFVVLLNFPLTLLDERLQHGATWSRREWAEVRLAQRFSKRIPAGVELAIAEAEAKSGQYIAEYNIWAHHLLDPRGRRLFPAGLDSSATGISATRSRPITPRRRLVWPSSG